MNVFLFFIIFIFVGLFGAQTAQAVPPPDFIFNVGRQVIQVFSLLILGFSIGLSFLKQFFETNIFYNHYKKWIWIAAAGLVIAISYFIADWYGGYSQKQEYSNWLKESQNQARTINSNSVAINPTPAPQPTIATSPKLTVLSFFEQASSTPLNISNADFNTAQENAYVLDAREDEEYENGRYPGSHHIRFADLVDGAWKNVPTNQPIYVICWSGIRGKEAVTFLRTKKILAQYLETGADGWVTFGGKWDGAIKFRSVYTDKKYEVVFSTEEVRRYVAEGTILIDSRPKEKYGKKHIPGSINIPIIYTPNNEIENIFMQVPKGASVITICDDFVSCFDATIVGAKFEKRQVNFLGRFNKPWDY